MYAINPSHSEVLGLKTYKGIGDVPEQVDLAAVVTPAVTVAQVIGECVGNSTLDLRLEPRNSFRDFTEALTT